MWSLRCGPGERWNSRRTSARESPNEWIFCDDVCPGGVVSFAPPGLSLCTESTAYAVGCILAPLRGLDCGVAFTFSSGGAS